MQEEFDYYITPDGEEHNLHDFAQRVILTDSGYGMPPIEWQTRRGPQQHGETAIDYRLRPRVVQLQLHWVGCGRDEYWAMRGLLLDIMRPNRTATALPGRLRKVLPNGEIRDLYVQVEEGPDFGRRSSDEWNEWSFDTLLRLIAFDPIWFDGVRRDLDLANVGPELVFPIDPFIIFGPVTAIMQIVNIVALGTWHTWPIVECMGPMANPTLDNLTIGEKLQLNYTILGGRTVTIDLTPGRKTVYDDLGNNLLAYISEDSDLATFRLEVDPIAPGGINEIQVVASGVQLGVSELNLRWYNRWIGI